MNKKGPIIIIEDDSDDRELLKLVFADLNYDNDVQFFPTGIEALEYLADDTILPFIILSDINLPKLNGLELRKRVQTNEELSRKCIPYLFFSTAADRKAVCEAYSMSVQGFFEKPTSFKKLKEVMSKIIDYWTECYSPNHFAKQIV